MASAPRGTGHRALRTLAAAGSPAGRALIVWQYRVALGLALLASGAWADPVEDIRRAVAQLCPLAALTAFDAELAVPGAIAISETHRPDRTNPQRSTLHLSLPDASELRLARLTHNGRLRQFRVEYWARMGATLAPARQAIADGSCTLRAGRAIRAGDGPTRYLDQLEGDLRTLRWTETLQAPWPAGTDPGGIRVALIDSGLAYDLPLFRDRLARDADGQPLGYDFWDDDPWPYDGDTTRSAFLPIRHGTTVASILATEAPEAALLPFRYPQPDMTRMREVVARAHNAGARILVVPLGSARPSDWKAFASALETHDVLAIVSAGNDGRNIDAAPVYPAALSSDRIVVVTSADGFGRLANGSNWGPDTVDLMVPGENISVTDFRGAHGVASGTSYAAPRVAALAARLLAADPSLSTAELRARLFALARPSPYTRERRVAVGWIADPEEHPPRDLQR